MWDGLGPACTLTLACTLSVTGRCGTCIRKDHIHMKHLYCLLPRNPQVYDAEQWAYHRSTKRYARHMKGILSSRIVMGLRTPLLYVVGISLAVCCYQSALEQHLLPELVTGLQWPSIADGHLSSPFSLSTFALSLLLVFRTNTSYQR